MLAGTNPCTRKSIRVLCFVNEETKQSIAAKIPETEVDNEIKRFECRIHSVAKELESTVERLNEDNYLDEAEIIITHVYMLKDKLKHIWTYRSRTWAGKALDQWCELARSIHHPSVTSFAKTLERYRYGILNHCDYPIHTGKIEGVNNKIKVIKRKAYGFHDLRYFTLKTFQAFYN